MNAINKSILMATLGASMMACDSFFDLRPQNEMVLDEFWTSEADVLSMTASCYRTMQEPGFMQRLMVWGEMRCDNVILGNGDGGDLSNIASLNLLPSNNYAYWGDFYNVINLCNTIELYAPQAYDKDPNFTEAQLKGYIAEAKGVRALCYFTLVRSFRDIPFIKDPVIDDTQSFQVAQSDPKEVIDYLIEDLKSVENTAVASWSNLAYTKGRITQNCIRALIADMCLWQGRYQECVDFCDKVLNDTKSKLALVPSATYNRSVFVDGNSTESIFELQFLSNNIPNNTIYDFYYAADGNQPRLKAYDFSTTDLFVSTDIRAYDFFFPSKSGAYPIKKYCAYRTDISTVNMNESRYTNIGSSARNSNWVFYRLPDIYLMKAEALVELNQNMNEAFRLVSLINDRANPEASSGTLDPSAAASQQRMRDIVFEERQREFLFEGKRYYDLIRRINRDRTQYSTLVNKYLLQKYVALDQSTVTSKLGDYNSLFMPIKDTELKANLLLKQNPFYKVSSDIDIK